MASTEEGQQPVHPIDNDTENGQVQTDGLKHADPKVNEPNPAQSEQEDNDSEKGQVQTDGLKHAEPKVMEPNPAHSEQEVVKPKADRSVLKMVKDVYKRDILENEISKLLSEIHPPGDEVIILPERVIEIDKKLDSAIYLDNGAIHIKVGELKELLKGIEVKKPLETIQCSDNNYREIKVTVPLPSGATKRFFEAFRIELMKRGIRAVDVLNFTDAATTDVVMVICHNSSRLDANVKSALSLFDEKQYKRIFLVIFQMNKKSVNLQQSSKEQLQDTEEFRNFNNIVDIACDKDGNVYPCEVNDKAFKEIEKQYSRNFLKNIFDWGRSKSF